MGEQVEVDLVANDRASPAWKQQADMVHQYLGELAKLNASQQQNEKSAREYDKAAKQIFDSTRTPLERYYAGFQKLNNLYADGKVDVDTYARGLAQLQSQRDDEDGTAAGRMAAQKLAHDQLQKELTESKRAEDEFARSARQAIEQGLTPLERYNRRVSELKGLLQQNKISQDQFTRSVTIAKDEMAKAGSTGVSAMSGLGNQITSLVGGYASLTMGVNFFRQANEAAMKEAEEAATKQDDIVRRFRAQAGLSEIQGEAAKADIYRVGEAVAASPEQAFGAATSLVSTGFSTDEATGGSLEPFLKLIAAQTLDPKKATSAGDMAENFSQFLSATGQEKNGGNVEKLAVAIQSLKATPLKVTDMAQLSKVASALKEMGRMTPEEMLSNFAYLRNTLSDESAAMGMREITKNLAVAGTREDRVEVFKSMGMKGEDVDFVGEDLQEVLKRVQTGLTKLPESKRAGALEKLVEGANIATFQLMAGGQEEVAKLRQGLGDKAGFEDDVEIGTSGRNAAARRQASRRERTAAERNNNRDLYGSAVEETERDKGLSDSQVALRRTVYDSLTWFGVSPQTAAGVTSGGNVIGGGSNADTTNKLLESVASDMKGLRDDLKNAGEKPKKFEAKVDPAPAPPRPAAALAGAR